MAAKLGSYKQAHTSSPPLTLGNSRVVEGPAPLKELGSRAQAMRGENECLEVIEVINMEPRREKNNKNFKLFFYNVPYKKSPELLWNDLSHREQEYGLSPVWNLRCTVSCTAVAKPFPQDSH
ncbi:hypothetical protein L3Q82_000562 [Scortum barcoo]|uniref:Uncharacterized protein n=1 Tax=Scortum barcoo TaxID=214431 RepID=A0ACB8WEG6_9TELE|nr:hypothetical protein L3Q82_000562 [Scortum barcoo]